LITQSIAVLIPEATRRLLDAYPRIYFACHQRHRRDAATGTQVSAHQGQILDHLDEVAGTSLTALAGHMGVTPSTMSLNVDRLEAAGLARRTRDPDDSRRLVLRLTRAGARVKEAASVLEPAEVRALLRAMPAADRARGIEGLELLARAASARMAKKSRSRAWADARN